MKFKLGLSCIVLAFLISANFAQTDIEIKKKVSKTMPGMREGLTPAMEKKIKEMNNTTSTVYLKGSRMRTDSIMKLPNKTGTSFEPVTYTLVFQCDKQKIVSFNSRDKKYHQQSIGEQSSTLGKTARSGGSVIVSGNVTDTGERAKIFGFEARRLKQTIIFTPSANACLKETMQIDSDGWYADFPEYSCNLKPSLPDDSSGGNCLDNYDYQIKGLITGISLKEIKKVSHDGQILAVMEEEAVEVKKTTLGDTFFEPPLGYTAANSYTESPITTPNTTSSTSTSSITTSGSNDSLSLPSAGIEKQAVGEKKAGVIRIGIARPKVTTPESKKDPEAGNDIANASANFLSTALKTEKVEPILLESDSPDSECREKGCDYIFYANITQKRGGGMLGKMILMGAIGAAGGMVPGVGGLIGATVANQVLSQTMGKEAKAKDEFTLDYKVFGLDKNVISQAVSKKKTEKDGEDVLTTQLQEASKTVLDEIAKKGK